MKKIECRAGFVGFGEVNTPREFVEPRCAAAAAALSERGVEVFSAPVVSDDPEGAQAAEAITSIKTQTLGNFDALVICVAGWIPTWAVIKTIEPFKHKPMLLWGLSGWRGNGHFVTTADQAGTTALRAVMKEQGYNFKYLVNFKDSAPRYDEAANFCKAATAHAAMHGALVGMCGYRDMRLFGTLYDGNLLKRVIGAEIEHFDLMEAADFSRTIAAEKIEQEARGVRERWKFVREPASPETIENSVRLALAFKEKIYARGYDAFSFCDVDGVKRLMKFAPAGALTLLHDLADIPSTPENDAYGTVTELILKYLTGTTPHYMEFYEFTAESALVGVPDYVPASVTDGGVTVMPNAFGSFGEGLLNVSKVRGGIVTLARLAQVGGSLVMHAVLGEACAPEAWEEAGWAPPAPQLPSLEVKFPFPAEHFTQNVMGQHYIVSYGDQIALLADYCAIAGIEFIR